MALLHMLSEEEIAEDRIQEYFQDLYRVVCVGERPAGLDAAGGVVRTTYVVDWEQLVHLLEDYTVFGEDIVEVNRMVGEDASLFRRTVYTGGRLARA